MKKMILTAFAAAAVAVSAQAQTLSAQAGEQLTISSTADASAPSGVVNYQWFRNGEPIAGATGASYTIPAAQATGTNIKYHRRATVDGCAVGNIANSNVITINFYNVVVNGVRWADYNVTTAGVFAQKADEFTNYYQFNRTLPGDITEPLTVNWESPISENADWDEVNKPICPQGWRLPTQQEVLALSSVSNPVNGVWAAANGAKGNAVTGMFLGPKAATCSMDNMEGCIFLPAVGNRSTGAPNFTIVHRNGHGLYWTKEQSNNTSGFILQVHYTGVTFVSSMGKSGGAAIRCVQ